MSQIIEKIKEIWVNYWHKPITADEALENAYFTLDELENNYIQAQESDPRGHWEYKLDQAKGVVQHLEFIIEYEKTRKLS